MKFPLRSLFEWKKKANLKKQWVNDRIDGVFPWAALAKYHRLESLSHKHWLLTVLKARKSKIKALADPVLGENPSLAHRWLSSHCLLTWGRAERERNQALASLLIRTLIPSWGPTHMTSSNPDYLLKVPSPNTIPLGFRISAYGWGGGGGWEGQQPFWLQQILGGAWLWWTLCSDWGFGNALL